MAFRLPRLPRDVPIVDPKTGMPTIRFQRYWQSVLEEIEGAINSTTIAHAIADTAMNMADYRPAVEETSAPSAMLEPSVSLHDDIAPTTHSASQLNELADLLLSLPATNHIIYYDGTLRKWRNIADPTIATVRFGDVNYYASLLTGNPILNFATGDYILYDRTGNTLDIMIGGALAARVSATQLYSPSEVLSPTVRAGDVDFYLGLLTGNPTINFATSDYMLFNRTSNELEIYIGGAIVAKFTAAGTEIMVNGVRQPLLVDAVDTAGAGFRNVRVPN